MSIPLGRPVCTLDREVEGLYWEAADNILQVARPGKQYILLFRNADNVAHDAFVLFISHGLLVITSYLQQQLDLPDQRHSHLGDGNSDAGVRKLLVK